MLVTTYTEQVREFYAAFGQGEVERMLDRMDMKVTWEAPCGGSNLPWGGVYEGKAGFMDWLETYARHVNIEVFEQREFIEETGRVVVFVYSEIEMINNGRKMIDPEVHYWTFKGDRLVKFQAFNNVAAQEAAFLGI
jgi:ketosteroid isomerase-like protein